MKKLAIDIDGVIANLVDSMLPHMNHFFDTHFCRSDVICFDFHKAFNMSEDSFNKFWSYMQEKDLWRSLAPIPGALNKLCYFEKHIEFEYITSRIEENRIITEEWLNKYGFPKKTLQIVNRKNDLADNYYFFIDDRLEECLELTKNRNVKKVFLFDAPWNQLDNLNTKIRRIYRWDDFNIEYFL